MWSALQGSWKCDGVSVVGGTLAGPDWRVASRGKRGPLQEPQDRWMLCLCPPGWGHGSNTSSEMTRRSSSSQQG